MGKINQGILGGFNGKVGTVIGGTWHGISYMRAVAKSRKNPKTVAQTAQRMKFAFLSKFVRCIKGYVSVGYRNHADGQTARSAATSEVFHSALVGKYPKFGVNPARLQLSKGSLQSPVRLAASVKDNVATFTWKDNSDNIELFGTDAAMAIVVNFTENRAVYSLSDACRADGKVTVEIPEYWSGDNLSCYLAFASSQNNSVSNSEYLGDVKSDGSVVRGANGIFYSDGTLGTAPTVPSEGESTPSVNPSEGGASGGGSEDGEYGL